jgi:hypothetical protein
MKRRRWPELLSLLITGALAVTLGTLIYLAATGLPFLSISPTSDVNFGAANACLLKRVPERLGFAVSADAQKVAAWSTDRLSVCSAEGEVFALPLVGLHLGRFDRQGNLWLAQGGPVEQLLKVSATGEVHLLGPMQVLGLEGTSSGAVVMQSSGHLVAVHSDGSLRASQVISPGAHLMLGSNASGEFVSVLRSPQHAIYRSGDLSYLGQAPCDIQALSWERSSSHFVVRCDGVDGLVLRCEAETMQCEALPLEAFPKGIPVHTISVEPCDGLPCTVVP